MFEWLEQEISQIKTPRFHVVDGPASAMMKEAILNSDIPCPKSYKEFVLIFGNAKLYRRSRSNSYEISIWGSPRSRKLPTGEIVNEIGSHDGAIVYVSIRDDGVDNFPIYEYEDGVDLVSGEFTEWLKDSCQRAKKKYTKEKWGEIIKGPEPFSEMEKKIISARKQCRWRMIGIDENGSHVFEFENNSSLILPTFTVGIRSRDRRLNGAVYLKVGHIHPGTKGEIHIDCYKGLVPSGEIEAFSLPEPNPENREEYREFDLAY